MAYQAANKNRMPGLKKLVIFNFFFKKIPNFFKPGILFFVYFYLEPNMPS
jgi:hypothetical protein